MCLESDMQSQRLGKGSSYPEEGVSGFTELSVWAGGPTED